MRKSEGPGERHRNGSKLAVVQLEKWYAARKEGKREDK
jgi:hypothetical protein